MKILAISDTPSKALWDYCTKERLAGIDLILSCGDLPKKYLEYLTNFTAAPILYVHGNHDGSYRQGEPGGCICVDDEIYIWKGLRIMGLGGCIRYNKDPEAYQYTEREMRSRVRKLWFKAHRAGGIDLLLTHSPASGINDGFDKAHKGFVCFNDLLEEYRPNSPAYAATARPRSSMPPSDMSLRSPTRTRQRGGNFFGKTRPSRPRTEKENDPWN